MKKLIIIACLSILTGCAEDTLAVMHNSKTGQIAQCHSNPDDAWLPGDEQEQIDRCVQAYEKTGYKRIDEPAK